MEKNQELRNAWEFVEHTGMSVFLTGKAGTGKTTFLRTVREHSSKRMVVVAPTGVAAINAGGVTIHSFFQLPLAPFVPETQVKTRFDFSKEKRKIIRTLDLLIIDEISMVRSDTLDAIDSVLRRFREHDKPFGGVQLIMIGDLQQLTPVVTPDEEPLLQRYYETPYFFSSRALRSINYVTIELTRVYRQHDDSFITILNHIRDGHATAGDLAMLNARYRPGFCPETGSDYIRLTTHNRMADSYNQDRLHALGGRSCTYTAETDGQFPDYNYPADYQLTLKVGAQVMFIHNDSNGKYYNGKIGHVTYVDDEHIHVLCPDDAEEIDVAPNVWENTKYTLNEKTRQIESEVQGTFRQYPLRLAWAITIHKSQGLTFEHAIIDAQSAFASGQVYVALSRCRSLEGLVLATPVVQEAIINDNRVRNYMDGQAERTNRSIESLPTLKETYYRSLLMDMFSFAELQRQEAALFRVLSEFFYKYPKVNALHKMILSDLDTRIVAVADKWIRVIGSLPEADLHGEEFIARVRKSALYFQSSLVELFDRLIDLTKGLETGNKVGMKRYGNAFSDLQQTYLAKRYLLEDMTETDFTVAGYLKAKQDAILSSMGEGDAPKRRRERKAKAAKVPKERTDEISYRLFRQGKSFAEIAAERGLNVSTVQNHFVKRVRTGEMKVEELIGRQKSELIRRIVRGVGSTEGMKPIKMLCPADVTYGDIALVLASLRPLRQGER